MAKVLLLLLGRIREEEVKNSQQKESSIIGIWAFFREMGLMREIGNVSYFLQFPREASRVHAIFVVSMFVCRPTFIRETVQTRSKPGPNLD